MHDIAKKSSIVHFSTIRNIIGGIWAISPDYALSRLPVVAKILAGDIVDISPSNSEPILDRDRNVAIIPIHGEILRDDECITGTETIGQWIAEADADPDIHRIIMDINSPGGTVDGTIDLAQKIRNTQTETIAYINTLAASAAYWLASQADQIIAANEFAEVGSIGVMLSLADMRPMLEKEGVRFHDIVSDLTPEKNQLFRDILEGKYETVKKEKLNPLAEKFISDVRAGRPNILDYQLRGKTFFARDVLGSMVDGIASDISALFPEKTDNQNYIVMANENIQLNDEQKKTFAQAFLEFLGLGEKSEEKPEQTISRLTAKIDELAEKLIEKNAQVEELEKKLSSISEEYSALEQKLNDALAENTKLKEELESLRKLPAATDEVAPETDAVLDAEPRPVADETLPWEERLRKIAETWKTQ